MRTIRGVAPGFDPRYTKDFHCPQSKWRILFSTSTSTRERTAVHSQRTYKYLSWSVSPCIVPWCIWVSLLEDRSLKTDKFQTIMWRCLFLVDLNEDKPVCNGPRSRMRRVRCTHYKAIIRYFPFVELRLCKLNNKE